MEQSVNPWPYMDLASHYQTALPPSLKKEFSDWWRMEGVYFAMELERDKPQLNLVSRFDRTFKDCKVHQSLCEEISKLPGIGEKTIESFATRPHLWVSAASALMGKNPSRDMRAGAMMQISGGNNFFVPLSGRLTVNQIRTLRAWIKSWQ